MIEFSVSSINNYIKNILTSDINLKSISLEGEVCAFKDASKNGHLYFELKDEDSRIKCVFFNIFSKYSEIPFKEGDNVILNGRIDVYEKSGQYQFIVSDLKISGIGDLYIKFIELKNKLSEEGVFNATKRELPLYPYKIGLITSPTGAAIRDFTSVIKRRFPIAKIFLYPVHVQGVETVNGVCNAIDKFNQMDLDIVVLTRGGGSYDELAIFNNEKIARHLIKSIHPTVSAIGHEPDFLITDFVADKRAATPTAAAEIMTPDLYGLNNIFKDRLLSNINMIFNRIENQKNIISYYERMINLKSPLKLIEEYKSEICNFEMQLKNLYRLKIIQEKNSLNTLNSRLIPFDIKKILNKGYSITFNESGQLLLNMDNYNKGDKIKTVFNKGSIISKII